MIWAVFAILTLAVLVFVIRPLVRPPSNSPNRRDYDLRVYRDQLREVERDLEVGLLKDNEAEFTKVEIQRRIIAATDAGNIEEIENMDSRLSAIVGIAVSLPFIGLALYLGLGSPDLIQTDESQTTAADHQDQDLSQLVRQLSARLESEPESVEGWVLLARSYREMGRFNEAQEAYQHALKLIGREPTLNAEYGEFLVTMAGGNVSPAAQQQFFDTLLSNPSEPRARFYLGLAQAQAGNSRDAIAIWRDLTATAPGDAPWLSAVRQEMGRVAAELGVPPITVQPRHPLSESLVNRTETSDTSESAVPLADPEDYRPDVGALAGRFSSDELEMIQGMVGGLAARLEDEPEDYEGWMQLGRSYVVLNNRSGALSAYLQAINLRPELIDPKMSFADLLMDEVDLNSNDPLPELLIKTAEEVLAIKPNQPDALFVTGLAQQRSGASDAANKTWLQLLDVLPADAPQRRDIENRLNRRQ